MDKNEFDERVLENDYPIYGNYLYVADGCVYQSDYHDITVAELKRREGFKEVRNCNISARHKAGMAAA